MRGGKGDVDVSVFGLISGSASGSTFVREVVGPAWPPSSAFASPVGVEGIGDCAGAGAGVAAGFAAAAAASASAL